MSLVSNFKTDVICPRCGSSDIYEFGLDDYTIDHPLVMISLDCRCEKCKKNILVSMNLTLTADVLVIDNDD